MSVPPALADAPGPVDRPWLTGACAGLAAAGARALLFALRDGYLLADGLRDVGARSLLLDLGRGAALAVPAGLLLAALARSGRGGRLAAAGLAIAGGLLFLGGRLPASPFHAPGFGSGRALAAHGAAAAVALVLAGAYALSVAGAVGRLARVLALAGGLGAAGLAGVAGALLESGPERPEGPGVVLVSLDTLRPDRLGAFGSERGLTPALDALAAESLRFPRAWSPEPFTLTAHMTLLTGLTPSVHGLEPDRGLPDGVTTLAASFREAGWVTAAVVDTVVWLEPRYGFARGFDVYRRVEGDASAKDAVVRLLAEDVGDRPLFLFVHVYDAHSDESVLPYEAEPDHLAAHAGWYEGEFTGCLPERGCASSLLLEMNRRGERLEGDERRWLASLYDAGVASLDARLDRLFGGLRESGVLDRSLTVVTADHGEEFYEHGRALHDQSYDESLRVPFLVRLPGGAPSGVRQDLVTLADVAPTVRAFAGLPDVPGQGVSFAGALAATPGASARDAVLLDTGRGSLGVVTERWKLVPTRDGPRLFDLAADPEEQRDLLAGGAPPPALAALRDRLARWDADVRAARTALGLPADPAADEADLDRPLDDDALRQLEALGYTGEVER